MPTPTTLTFRKLPRSQSVEQLARQLVERFKRRYGRLGSCHFVVDRDPGVPNQESGFRVQLHLRVPNAEIHANSDGPNGMRHQGVQDALRAACDSAERQLRQLQCPAKTSTAV